MSKDVLIVGDGGAIEIAGPSDIETMLDEFDRNARQYDRSKRPKNTKDGYESDWRVWCEFVAYMNETAGIPVRPEHVRSGMLLAFVKWMDEIKVWAPSGIRRRITGTVAEARDTYHLDLPDAVAVLARREIRRYEKDEARVARGRGKAVAATVEMMERIAALPRDNLRRMRDVSLTLTAFNIAGRSEHVANLDDEHFIPDKEGYRVKIVSMKGEDPRYAPVYWGETEETCPILGYQLWRENAQVIGGPAYRAIHKSGSVLAHRLTPRSCRDIVAATAERAGIEVRLTGHSMRAGFITVARQADRRVEKIKLVSGHSLSSKSFWEYIRDADLFADGAGKGLLGTSK